MQECTWITTFLFVLLAVCGVWIVYLVFRVVRSGLKGGKLLEIVIALTGLMISIVGLAIDLQGFCGRQLFALEIKSPAPGAQIAVEDYVNGSALLHVQGTSRRVFEDDTLYVYVLIHPVHPYAEGWWIAAPVRPATDDGWWKADVWIGSQASPVQAGDRFELVAAVAPPGRDGLYQPIADPQALDPRACSRSVEFSIASVSTPTLTPTPTATPIPSLTPTPTGTPTPSPTPTPTSTPTPSPTPTPRALTIANFDRCNNLNNLGGEMGAAYDLNLPHRLTEGYPQEPGRGCVARLEYHLEQDGWVAFWIKLQEANLSPYNTLYFWARAETPVSIGVKIELKPAGTDQIAFVYQTLDLARDWRRFSVPLRNFQLSSLARMNELVFTLETQRVGTPDGVFFLDTVYVQE